MSVVKTASAAHENDLFISYSRADQAKVELLRKSLVEAGFSLWLDQTDIPPGDTPWIEEIFAGIETATKFIFCMSQQSLESFVCQLELNHALTHGKPIIPVVLEEPPKASEAAYIEARAQALLQQARSPFDLQLLGDRKLLTLAQQNYWNGLKPANWVFYTSSIPVEQTQQKLVDAVRMNLGYLRFYNSLNARVREWRENHRSGHFLLQGVRLDEALDWLSRADQQIRPFTVEQLDFVQRSRHARQWRRLISVAVAALIIAVLGLITWEAVNQSKARELNASIAATNDALAQANQRQSWREQSVRLADVARQQMAAGRVQDAIIFGAEALSHYPEIYNWESHKALFDAVNYPLQEVLYIQQDVPINGLRWNRDESRVLSWSQDGTVQVWDVSTGALIVSILDEQPVYEYKAIWNDDPDMPDKSLVDTLVEPVNGAMWSRDDTKILSWSGSFGFLHDATTGQLLREFEHNAHIEGVGWSADESRLIIWSEWAIEIWDTSTEESTLYIHAEALMGMHYDDQRNEILTWSDFGNVTIWSAETGEALFSLEEADNLNGAAWSHDHTRVLTSFWDGTVRVWDVATAEEVFQFQHDDGILGALWNSDSTKILSWSEDQTARLWDVVYGGEIIQFRSDSGVPFTGAEWGPDEQTVYTWGRDGAVLIWDVKTGKYAGGQVNVGAVLGAAWDDGILTAWRDSGMLFLDTASARLWLNYDAPIIGAFWSRDGHRLIGWLEDQSIRLWHLSTSLPQIATGAVSGARWNKTDTQVLMWDTAGGIRVWDVVGQRERLAFSQPSVSDVIWNQAESQFLAWGEDGQLQVWDTETGNRLISMTHGAAVYGAAWDRGETRVLSWSADHNLRLWNATNGELLMTLSHDGEVRGAAWNPDETQILSWAEDSTLRVWDAVTGEPLQNVSYQPPIGGAKWSPSGQQFVFWSRIANEGAVWDVSANQMAYPFAHEPFGIGRQLTGAEWNQAGTLLATWADDKTVHLWDTVTGDNLLLLTHDSAIRQVYWHEDDSQLIVVAANSVSLWRTDGEMLRQVIPNGNILDARVLGDQLALHLTNDEVALWNLTSEQKILQFNTSFAAWNHDGTRLLAASDKGYRIWLTDIDQLLEAAERQRRVRPLSQTQKVSFGITD